MNSTITSITINMTQTLMLHYQCHIITSTSLSSLMPQPLHYLCHHHNISKTSYLHHYNINITPSLLTLQLYQHITSVTILLPPQYQYFDFTKLSSSSMPLHRHHSSSPLLLSIDRCVALPP